MKTRVLALLMLVALCVPSAVLAHKPLLAVEDNGDGTLYVETGFSDGSSGAGHKVILRNKETGDVLSELAIPEEGYLEEIPIPNVPYTVTFDAGPGHAAVKDGPFSGAAPAAAAESAPAEKPAEAAAETAAPTAPEAAAPPEPAPAAAAEPVQAAPQPAAAAPSGAAVQPMAAQLPMATTATMSPGVEMALKMMMTSQMVTALGVLIALGAVMFLIGYVVGKDAGKTR